MDAFALPLVAFTAFMIALLVALFWGTFDDPVPQRAAFTWAVSCPVAGLLCASGLAPLGLVTAAVSVLALGSLGYWFLAIEPDDTDDDAEEPVEPDPGPSDDNVVQLPTSADSELAMDWAAFDRARADWEQELAPSEPERLPNGV
ncbi:MAG TPA: hypothetical protein VGC59_00365 [Solirubrobacteraceae bacterium]